MERHQYYIKAQDGILIALTHVDRGFKQVVIVAHGFFNNKDTYFFQSLRDFLSKKYDVILFDFCGHGQSKGFFQWTSREFLDVRAAVGFAKEKGYEKIALMGFSLGAVSCIIETAQSKNVDSVIAVSCPYDFNKMDFRFWQPDMLEDLKLNWGFQGKGKRALFGNPFSKKIPPLKVIEQISPIPVLFIHGEKDWLISFQHAQKLFDKAKDPKKLCVVPEAGHAERIFKDFPDKFIDICFSWLEKSFMDSIERSM